MTKDEFKEFYINKYIKCYTQEQLNHIITEYAENKPGWERDCKNPNFIKENTYNVIGIVIKFDDDLNAC